MTYAPATLQTLAKYWVAQGGVNLGVVGDTAHTAKGYSYHLGKDQLSPTAYSVQTQRDKAGLTNGASAIDLGRLDGTFMNLRLFSSWLVAQARANQPGTSDIREIIYSPDGKTVLRWDRERGYASAPRSGEADDSHLTHTHISWYRDAERRDHTTAFRPFFAPPPDTSTEDPMPAFTVVPGLPTGTLTLKPDQTGVKFLRLRDGQLIATDPAKFGSKRPILPVRLTEPIVAGRPKTDDWTLGYLVGDDAAFVLARNVDVVSDADETFNAGVAAAAKAAATAKR